MKKHIQFNFVKINPLPFASKSPHIVSPPTLKQIKPS